MKWVDYNVKKGNSTFFYIQYVPTKSVHFLMFLMHFFLNKNNLQYVRFFFVI